MDFQQVIMRLNEFWADHGCLVWQPYNVQVGAGTMNPATVLRVLGPEPWNVAYLEPSVRPADGRYGENPNRWSEFYQYQVILKPDPGNPQELYLDSLRALGIDTEVDDVRFVEDNWESPALGAWGLGWEVWLNGQEISQYTYFQQAGGQNLDPVSVEITYGLERITMALQDVREFPQIKWIGDITYGDIRLRGEVEHCTYNFEVADVENLRTLYDLCEAEAKNALASGLAIPAHDYVLKCSHVFNVLDARGAVGVTERARYFVRMRDLAREVSDLYTKQREELGYPMMGKGAVAMPVPASLPALSEPSGEGPFDFLLEIGSEELPVGDLDSGLVQLEKALGDALTEARLGFKSLNVVGTPRRLVAQVEGLDAGQVNQEHVVKGPPARIAYDDEGNPTRAAQGFARSQGVELDALERRSLDGRDYVVAVVVDEGRGSAAVLAEKLPDVIKALSFGRSMRWNASGISYSRPLRWFVALLDDVVVPFEYAGVVSGRVSRGIRPLNCPEITIARAADYGQAVADAGIVLGVAAREAAILSQANALAAEVGGEIPEDTDLLREVANLVEHPLAIRGDFDASFLRLPDQVLLAVMRKHQRYLPVVRDGELMPHFIAIANGQLSVGSVRKGNQEVLRARYADAAFFYDADRQAPLAEYTSRLATLMFQEQLGSVLDKVGRLEKLVPELCGMLRLDADETATATRAAAICKSDLATQLVVELTSLQGTMGRHYARLSGETEAVAQAIEEHYLPRSTGDRLPESMAGAVLAIADRLDTLVGLFAVGVRPSGAADPWGLRRAALGLVHTLVAKGISLALPEALSQTAERLPVDVDPEALCEVMAFINRRYRGYLLDQGYRYDMVDAVLAEQDYDPFLAFQTLQALVPWVEREGWSELLDTYARCVRITRKEEQVYGIDVAHLREPAARGLYDTYVAAHKALGADRTVDTLFQVLTDLMPAIRRFFDDILVMDEDMNVRQTRLGLLQAIGLLTEGILDLAVMEGF